jgi:Secretion system C-terminal sorting domain
MKSFYLLSAAGLKKLRSSFFAAVLLLTAFSTKANMITGYTPSCVTAGQTVTIGVTTAFTYSGTWFHWQYRVNTPGAAPGAWTFLNGVAAGTPVNNTINGTVFAVSKANIISPVDNYAFSLDIANATTALNEVEFRVLIGPFGDPQAVPSPVWNGDDQNLNEAQTVRVRIKPATENCFSSCSDNILVLNPPSSAATPLEEYYGGFEAPANFGGTNADGSSVTAQTDFTQWVSGSPAANYAGVTNSAYSMIWLENRFAPHSGRKMLVAHRSDNATDRLWYKTLVAPVTPVQQYFGGQVTFRLWATKTGAGAAPCFAMEIKGTNAANVTTVLSALPVTITAVAGQPGFAPGDWVQYSLSYFVPAGIYKKLEVSVRGNCTTDNNFAIDDICLVTPSAAVLPVRLTSLTGSYADGVAHLNWATEQEINAGYFEIEQSRDGVNFAPLGKVAAAGFTSSRTAYQFNDVKAAAGINYYRLKMVDKDGRFEYSNIAVINVTIKGIIITGVYPNPFANWLNISIASETKGTATVRLFDNAGRTLVNQSATVNKGITLVNVKDLQKLAKGFYILEVRTGETVVTQKLIK